MSNWQNFFDLHAPKYMENVFTANTEAEVAFLIEHLNLPQGANILDIGCGTGRHSVALAQKGYRMTGVDLSSGMLAEAKKAAERAEAEVEWIQADATKFSTDKQFDGAICLCEGAFCLIGTDEDPFKHDLAILQNIHAALKPGAPFILTALNAFRMVRLYSQEEVLQGRFNPHTQVESSEIDILDGKQKVQTKERGYTPPELSLLLRHVGFQIEHLGGGTAGNWGIRPVELDEYEIMVIARK